ncbi:MAG: hypothetical protein FWE23_10675, partial [Chitinivibrionia bacterium]|nr:hypothetical protein [Chitinivibrionia bacterium]
TTTFFLFLCKSQFEQIFNSVVICSNSFLAIKPTFPPLFHGKIKYSSKKQRNGCSADNSRFLQKTMNFTCANLLNPIVLIGRTTGEGSSNY